MPPISKAEEPQLPTFEPTDDAQGVSPSGPWLDGGLAVLNPTGEILEVNAALASWLDQPAAALVGQPLASILGAYCEGWREAWASVDESGVTFKQADWEVPATEFDAARYFKVELTRTGPAQLFRLNSALPSCRKLLEQGCEHCFSTVPARRETYFRLLRAEEQLAALMERWPGIVFSQRPDGSFYFVSPRIEEFTGIPREEWEKLPARFWNVIHEADLQSMQRQLKTAAETRQPLASTFRIRHAATGKVAYVMEHRQALCSRSGLLLGYEGVWIDLTRQTLVEKRLDAAAWKETLAALTMGLAHDFRNVMAGIIGLTETFQAQLEPAHPFQQSLALMRSNAWQASQSIQRILQLHQGRSGEKSYQDLNELAKEMVEMSRRMLSRRIRLEITQAPGRLPFYVDPFEFRQAFLNLAVNARDAMSQGGPLRIETSRHTTLPELKFVRGKLPRLPAVCLVMKDTGSGIPSRHLPSIFDPFFTTKALDKGSGLGLYNVLLFVEKHQGAVSVDSEEGQGTMFRLWLPEADFTEAERAAQAPPSEHTLLVVGAPSQALDGTAEFLRANAFYAVVATSPQAAWECLRSPHYQFDAVILQTTAQLPHFFADIQKEELPVKLILQVIGCNPDELESSFIQRADLVWSAEKTGHEVVRKIRSLLASPA
jgi:PAS domain S-box-containing protein